MKRAALMAALVVSLAAGPAAMASDRGHDDHRELRRSHHEDRHDGRREDRRDFRRVPHRGHARYGAYHRPHGYYAHRWARGERLPFAYHARPYLIADYGVWGLRRPPRGYHWVRVDGDAVLAAIATGIVLDTVFHVFD